MDSPALVAPPYLAAPLRLEPFSALTLPPFRIGDPGSARAFARPYREVTARLRRWDGGGVRRDPDPAVYVHQYRLGDRTVRGIVGLLDLSHRAEAPGTRAVMPHEGVHPPQVEELATRMEAMELNPAPILLVHRGASATRALLDQITSGMADRQFVDHADQDHRLWAVRDPALHTELADSMARAHTVIADGHHRYAAYLRLQSRHPGTGWDRGLAMVIDLDDSDLRPGPIHRVLRHCSWAALDSALGRAGLRLVRCADEPGAPVARGTVLVHDGQEGRLLALDPLRDHSTVEVFHDSVEPHLPPRARLTYHHDVPETLAVRERRGGLALIFPPIDFEDITRAVAVDRLLPEKATSFQPKPHVGVLIRPVHG